MHCPHPRDPGAHSGPGGTRPRTHLTNVGPPLCQAGTGQVSEHRKGRDPVLSSSSPAPARKRPRGLCEQVLSCFKRRASTGAPPPCLCQLGIFQAWSDHCPVLSCPEMGPKWGETLPLRPSQVAEGSQQTRSLLCRVCIAGERFFSESDRLRAEN